jgi:hypothetical protein
MGIWAAGSLAIMVAALVADARGGMSPLVEVALISSISSLLVAISTGAVSIYLQRQTGKKVDGLYTEAHRSEQAANTRADTAEGFKAGSDSERERK